MTPRQTHLLCLFACGVLIGFLLEIIIVEKNQFHFFFRKGFLIRQHKVSCLVLHKHKTMNFINSLKITWMKHCDSHVIVNVRRQKKQKNKFLKASKEPEYNLKFNLSNESSDRTNRRLIGDHQMTTVVANSGWSGLCKALHVAKDHQNEWLLVVPDSSMVLIENLKFFVKNFDSDQNHYYGYGIKHFESDYNVLSAGILLSRGTLKLLFEKFKNGNDCNGSEKYWRNEDLYLGKYLKEFGILPKDTRDENGRGRFHGFNLHSLMHQRKLISQLDYFRKALYPVPKGFNCCSPFSITFDVSDPDAILKIYFFLYKVSTRHKRLPLSMHHLKRPEEFFWKDFLRSKGYSENAIENMTSAEYYKIWEKILPPEDMYNQMRNFVIRKVQK